MENWWVSLSGAEQFFLGIAVFFTTIFICQTLMLLFGLGDHDSDIDSGHDFDHGVDHDIGDDSTSSETDSDSESHEFHIGQWFTVRSMVAFFLGFSWSALGFLDLGYSTLVSTLLGILVGIAMASIMLFVFKTLSSLSSDGTINLKNAIGTQGQVLIRISANKTKPGKISLVIQGKLMDIDAITTETTDIVKGENVRVDEIQNNQLIVSRAN